jgi:cytochrome P450
MLFEVLIFVLILALIQWYRKSRRINEAVYPRPVIVSSWLPFVGCALSFVSNPTQFLNSLRSVHGDTPLLLDVFGVPLYFVFSGGQLNEFYRVREQKASFKEATKSLLLLKLPEEIVEGGDLASFRPLMSAKLMRGYASVVKSSKFDSFVGAAADVDIFVAMRREIGRIGLGCWTGVSQSTHLDELFECCDSLDPESAFVDLKSVAWTMLTRKAGERRAFDRIVELIAAIRREQNGRGSLESLFEHYADAGDSERKQQRHVARDVVVLQIASLANLYSALGWVCVHLANHTRWQDAVRAEFVGDSDDSIGPWPTTNRVLAESLRLSQRSITLRKVVADEGSIELAGARVSNGVYIATLLSCTNEEIASTRAHQFDPEHYDDAGVAVRRQFAEHAESVSIFGHGVHRCVGVKFAQLVAGLVLRRLLGRYTLVPSPLSPAYPPATNGSQVGAVARPSGPCFVRFVEKR